ncbi:MAG: InlB B-repeat-containing protein, partial [Firmicutes bacterium]|nr:InlB B-repeat-containing protein [Bacillota bacterium]
MKKIPIRSLVILIIFIMAACMLPVHSHADVGDYPYSYFWICPRCGEGFEFGSYSDDLDYDKIEEWAYNSGGQIACDQCKACSHCFEEWHCSQCGACAPDDKTFNNWCEECNICAECMGMHPEHCTNCHNHFGDERGPECEECGRGICIECHNIEDYRGWCDICGACLYAKYDSGDICPSWDGDPSGDYAHCAEHCEGYQCNECGNCFLAKGDDYLCHECYTCPECIDAKELHCQSCGQCFEGPAERCDDAGGVICVSCCTKEGNHCPDCGEHVDEDGWCPTGGKGSHCLRGSCAGETCSDCGVCFDCADLEPCPDCGLCPDCCRGYSERTGCQCGFCVESTDYFEHLCPNCSEPACTKGDAELCPDCGFCSECCRQISEDAGCECGMCVESADFSDPFHLCEQCGEHFSCVFEFCRDCGLCEDCCLENSEAEGCNCGDPVCVQSSEWADHYCADCGHCVSVCDCDPSCGCEQCGGGGSFVHEHQWDTDGFCVRCGASVNGDPLITVQPRKEIHGVVSNYREVYYDNTFTVAVRVRDNAKVQWYRSTSPTGTGIKLEDHFDSDSGFYAVKGAASEELTTYIPTDACTTTYYYYCVVTNPENGRQIRSESAKLAARHKHKWVSYGADSHIKQCVGQGCKDGYNASSVEEHQFGPDIYTRFATTSQTGVKTRVCAKCGYKKTVSIPRLDADHSHSYKAAVSDKNPAAGHIMVCSCGARLGGLQSHDWLSWQYNKFPTVTSAGERYHICRDCGYKAAEKVFPIRNHEHFSYDQQAAQEAAAESGKRDKYNEYLHLYRETCNAHGHWFECDEAGCNAKFGLEEHEWIASIPSNWKAKPPAYDPATRTTRSTEGRVWLECRTCSQTKTYDFAYGSARVIVTNGKADRSTVSGWEKIVKLEAKVPEGREFVRWEVKNGGGKLPNGRSCTTIADPYSRDTTFTYSRKYTENGKTLGMDYNGDELVWIECVTRERDPYVYLTNPKTGGLVKLDLGCSLYKDGSVREGGSEDDLSHVAYFFDDNVLYLNDYRGDRIELRAWSAQDFTVILQGRNVIDSKSVEGLICNDEFGGDLTITTDRYTNNTGSLEINVGSRGSGYGIAVSSGIRNKHDVTISGSAEIKINVSVDPASGNKDSDTYGIFATGDLSISDGAAVEIKANGPNIKPGSRTYNVYGLYARNNITIDTEEEVNITLGTMGWQDGAAIKARNVFYDMVAWSELTMGTDMSGKKVLPAVRGELILSEDLGAHKYEKYTDRHITRICGSIPVKLPEGEGYRITLKEGQRVDSQKNLIASNDDVIKLRVDLEPGYLFARNSCMLQGGRYLSPVRDSGAYQDFDVKMPDKGYTDPGLSVSGIRRIDPFKSVSRDFTAHPEAAVSLAYTVESAEYELAKTEAKGSKPWIFVEKKTADGWEIVEGGSAKLASAGRVTFTDPDPASSGSKDTYRFVLPLAGDNYRSDAIEVTRSNKSSALRASAVELYVRQRDMYSQLEANGYPAAYDDYRTWVRMDAEHSVLYKSKRNGERIYSYTAAGSMPDFSCDVAARFDAETGTLILYAEHFMDSKDRAGASIGAIRVPSDSRGDLTIRPIGNIEIQNNTVKYYRKDGKADIQAAAISNPGGGIVFTSADADTLARIDIYTISEPDSTMSGGKLTGFTVKGIEAGGDVVLRNKAVVDIYPECGTKSSASAMQKFIGIHAQGSICLEDRSGAEIIMIETGFDQGTGFLSEGRNTVFIDDSASVDMEIRTDENSPHTLDSSCITADECNIYTSSNTLYFTVEQNNPGTARGINVRTGSELDLADTNLRIVVCSADRGCYCFGGTGTIGFQSVGHTELSWMDAGGSKGAAFEQTDVDGLDGPVTVIGPSTYEHPSLPDIVFYGEHIVDGAPRSLTIRDNRGNNGIASILWTISDLEESFNRRPAITVPGGSVVYMDPAVIYEGYSIDSRIPVEVRASDRPLYKYMFTMPDCDVQLVMQLKGEKPSYNVTAYVNNSLYTGDEPEKKYFVSEGEKLPAPAPLAGLPGLENWEFTGWFADQACTAAFDFDKPITAHTGVYAGWRKLADTGAVSFTVSFSANGHGTAPATQTVKSGGRASKPADPAEEGWIFGGWYTESSCVNAYDFGTAVTKNTRLYAKWTKGAAVIKPGDKTPGEKDTIPFTDVYKSDYYYDAVVWAFNAEPQVTDGTSPTTFSPKNTCTRGQVVTFLWRVMGCPEPKTKNNPFADVKESDWFYKPVLWAVEQGITDGTSPTTFSPKTTCKNSHILTFIWRA